MTISEKEKKYLSVLAVVVAIALIYLLGYKPLHTKATTLKEEVATMETQVIQYQATLKPREFYETEIQTLTEAISQIDERLPQALPQELVIQTMDALSDALKMDLPTLGFTEVEEIPLSSNASSTPGEAGTQQVNSTLTGLKTSVTTATTCSYDAFKLLLTYVRTLPMEIGLENIALGAGEDSLAVSFNISLYGLKVPGRNKDFLSLGEYNIGKDNLFNYNGIKSSKKDTTVYEGLFMILDPVQSDLSAITMGCTRDNERKTYVYEETNAPSEVKIDFTQDGSKYYVRYQVGEENYPVDGSRLIFTPQSAIGIQVESTKRINANDLNEAKVTINNSTDKMVYIYVQNDDEENPRFNLVQAKGNVQLKE